jgi:hypothetical protein
MKEDIWGPIEIDKWDETPYLAHRVATEKDVIEGTATFYISGANNHKQIDIKLPSMAILIDQDTHEELKVIIIQAEQADDRQLIGYRFIDGGNGVCTMDEVKLI